MKTGERREASFFACFTFFTKVLNSISGASVGYALAYAGYVSGDSSASQSSSADGGDDASEQPDSVVWTLRVLHVVLPSVLLSLALVFIYYYDLKREKHQDILEQLRRKRARSRNHSVN